ncbi:MAG: maleylacetoacetate isomerase [Pseudomonadota bacterium]
MKLYGYWRSTASYRIRMALALKHLDYTQESVDLAGGAQLAEGFEAISVQRLVPVLELDNGARITQSQAIIDYLEHAHPARPLLPSEPFARAEVLSFAAAIACDIHPLGNLRVQKYVGQTYGVGREGGPQWAKHWIEVGFAALETKAAARQTCFLCGDQPGYAECFLIPQIYNAVRFGVDMRQYPALSAVNDAVLAWDGIAPCVPEAQHDANP